MSHITLTLSRLGVPQWWEPHRFPIRQCRLTQYRYLLSFIPQHFQPLTLLIGIANSFGGVKLSFISQPQMVTVTVGGHTKKILLSFRSLWSWPEALNTPVSPDGSGCCGLGICAWKCDVLKELQEAKPPASRLGMGLVPLRPVLGNQPEQYN